MSITVSEADQHNVRDMWARLKEKPKKQRADNLTEERCQTKPEKGALKSKASKRFLPPNA